MSVLGLSDAKNHLNIPSTTTTYDTELQAFIDGAEAAIAQQVGPLSTSTVTKRVPGYGWNLHLPVYPAVSLTSVTPTGSVTALTLSTLYLDSESGTVSRNDLGFFTGSAYDVVYVAGRSTVPANLLQSVKDRLKLDWVSQRGGASRPGSNTDGPAVKSWPEILADLEPNRLRTLGA